MENIKEKNKLARIEYIDIARAIAILVIVLGHTLNHSENCKLIFKFLYSFNVVLFFILSGYTFKIRENESFYEFAKRKFIRIMIPYFIWKLLWLIPYIFLGKNVGNFLETESSFDIKAMLINILYGNGNSSALKQNSSLWFLPALFSIEIIYYYIIKFINISKRKSIVVLIFSLLISYASTYLLEFKLPWGINTVLNIGGIFFLIGYLLNNMFEINKLFKIYYIFPILIIGILAMNFNSTVSCIDYIYGNLTLAILSGLCLSIVIIYISYLIKNNKILEYIGRITMGILIFHKLVILIVQTKLGVISTQLKNSNILIEFLLSIVTVMLSVVFSLICVLVLRKILPILIGENKSSK